ncbi:hypothetical protein [Flavobacterium psychrotolerans]|uniref:Uncharacterized protein n=1 Tax=Flavobacterium psychrotolerans TaxID=2169410 RepID=A0A2U1JP91_9FLAO|nr:hypothetical protein [Flavobacterium psychrotolerans]PWA06952.1 hypothetical protein DB895_02945 [Flavobacterium psychrotolerans]
MSIDSQKNIEDQEIDLSIISKGIGSFFQKLSNSLFRSIQFVIKHFVILGILIVIGVGLGLFLDKTYKNYDNQIIVTPNFGSTDYLYSKIDLIESRIKERDTAFLKTIGVQEPSKLSKIEIKPIIDIYRFINTNSEQNFELLKLMAEDGDIKKIVEEKTTSKNYTFHTISFVTKKLTTDKKTIQPIMDFLNTNDFYTKFQKEQVNNIKTKMAENDSIIAQIDGFLNSFSNTINGSTKSDKLVYYNENTQLNDVINTKNKLISEQGSLRLDMVSLDKIIKENSSTTNIENDKSVNGKLKLILPLLFIFVYIFIRFFIGFYRKQAVKNKL